MLPSVLLLYVCTRYIMYVRSRYSLLVKRPRRDKQRKMSCVPRRGTHTGEDVDAGQDTPFLLGKVVVVVVVACTS